MIISLYLIDDIKDTICALIKMVWKLKYVYTFQERIKPQLFCVITLVIFAQFSFSKIIPIQKSISAMDPVVSSIEELYWLKTQVSWMEILDKSSFSEDFCCFSFAVGIVFFPFNFPTRETRQAKRCRKLMMSYLRHLILSNSVGVFLVNLALHASSISTYRLRFCSTGWLLKFVFHYSLQLA